MKLVSLEITSLPGIDEPFTIDALAPDINVITGPNASGKSSLLRALGYLLAPGPGDPTALVLKAEFAAGSDRWRVARAGSQVQWQLNGTRSPPPPLPDRDTLESYLLRIDNLLALTGSDARLVAEFRRELAGGYDVAAARSTFLVQRGIDRRVANELTEAVRALRDAERANQALLDARDRLPQLSARIGAAKQAHQSALQYREALKYLALREACVEAEIAFGQFPERMPAPDCVERLERLSQQQDALRRQRIEAEYQSQHALSELRETGLEDARIEAVDIDTANGWLSDLRALEDKVRDAQQQLEAARARLRDARWTLGDTAADSAAVVSHEIAGRIEARALGVHEAAKHAAEWEGMARAHGDADARAPVRARFTAVAGVALVVAGAALLASTGWQVSVALSLLGTLLVAGGTVAGLWGTFRPGASPGDAARRFAQAQRQEAQEHLARLDAELNATLQQAGLSRGANDALAVHLLVQRLLRLDDCRAAEADVRARCAALLAQGQEVRARLADFLGRWDTLPTHMNDLASVVSSVGALQRRVVKARDCQRQITEAEGSLQRAARDMKHVRTELEALYASVALPYGERDRLLVLCGQLERWEQARAALQAKRATAEASRQRLDAGDETLTALIGRADAAAVGERLERAEARAAELDALISEDASIRAGLRQAEQAHPLEDRRAALDSLLDALALRYQQRMHAEAGQFLLDDVAAEHRSAHQPAALRRADAHFREFTHHQYLLELDDDGEPVAREARRNQRRTISELSVGTRMQLLIALRVGWAEQHEQHNMPMPLFLDEALTTTDPERFNAVAAALASTVARQQRQIFYLTAQAEDVVRWQRAIGRAPHAIDLAVVRRLAGAATEPLHLPAPTRIPSPSGLDAEAWAAQLGVPPITLHRDAAAIHLFHLLRDDLPLLHHLMDALRLHNVGQLESFLEHGAGRNRLESGVRRRLAQRIAVACAWHEACRMGRGRPVDRAALEQSPAGSWQTLDALTQRADLVGNEAGALLQSLRSDSIRNVGARSIERLAAWLEEQGYLDPSSPLDEAARYHHALAAVPADATVAREIAALVQWLETAGGLTPVSG
jgi:DNA repair protein SbcC/Rad50